MASILRTVLKAILLAPVVLLAGGVVLYFFGLRFELDGTGYRPIFYFGDKESRLARLEKSRVEQAKAAAPEPAPQTSSPAPPAPAAVPRAAEPKEEAVYWTDFRGPLRNGNYTQTPILTAWPEKGLKQLWRQPIGAGYASFVIAGGRAFTIEQRRDKEAVVAYDMATGRELWAHTYPGFFQEWMGGDGPRATPAYHAGLVYSMGALGELRVLEAATGKVKWQKNILSDNGAQNLQWGMAAAPLIVDDKVVVQPGGRGASVVAYNKLTGQPVWKSLDDKQAYTTPALVTLAGRRQILTVSGERAMGLAPEDGKLLWEFPWTTEYDVNAAMPVLVDERHFFISAGYGHGAALVEITGSGDRLAARAVWSNTRMKNKFSHSVLYQGHIYGFDEAILACVDVKTGELKWKGGRYGYGQLLLSDGHLVVTTEEGNVVLVKATPEKHTEVASFTAIEGKTWNVPAIDNGLLLVRNTTEMACYRLKP